MYWWQWFSQRSVKSRLFWAKARILDYQGRAGATTFLREQNPGIRERTQNLPDFFFFFFSFSYLRPMQTEVDSLSIHNANDLVEVSPSNKSSSQSFLLSSLQFSILKLVFNSNPEIEFSYQKTTSSLAKNTSLISFDPFEEYFQVVGEHFQFVIDILLYLRH